jgi:hypothetical protein
MSLPVSACLISRAAEGDPDAFRALVLRMHANLKCGHFTLGGCSHTPPCPIPTEQQMIALDARLIEALSILEQRAKSPVPPERNDGGENQNIENKTNEQRIHRHQRRPG